MLNSKSFHVIDKDKIQGNIHIVGVGALGSRVVENLVRLNLASKIIVYDMDQVEEKNLNNQIYLREHIGMDKVEAMQDYASKIDQDAKIRIKNKKVDYIRTKSTDVVVVLVDSFEGRASIISQLSGTPLLITGGISSIGGSMDVARGPRAYQQLAQEFDSLEDGQEYDENDLTPCGSPISIFHRIGFAGSLITDAILKHHEGSEELNYNVSFDVPNLMIFERENQTK